MMKLFSFLLLNLMINFRKLMHWLLLVLNGVQFLMLLLLMILLEKHLVLLVMILVELTVLIIGMKVIGKMVIRYFLLMHLQWVRSLSGLKIQLEENGFILRR